MKKFLPLLLLCLIIALGCARRPVSTAELPRLLSQRYPVAVAPFSQPLHAGQLISGQIPEDQGLIPHDQLLALDADLRDVLRTKTRRQYVFIPAPSQMPEAEFGRASGQPGGLSKWLAFGRQHDAKLLLVPLVLNWHEREGSEAGVSRAAHARLEFFLLNIPENGVDNRSVFEEQQVGLVDNLLSVGDFFRRKGQWITARQLAGEAMLKAVQELGL